MKQHLNEIKQLQKLAGLLKEGINEASSKSAAEKLEAILSNLSRNISTDSTIPTESKQGLLGAFNEMMDIVNDMLDAEEADSFYDDDDYGSDNPDDDYGPVSDYSKRRASELNEQQNPEGDKLVLRFLKGIAKKYDYSVEDAVRFVQERMKKLGYINEIDRNDRVLMAVRAKKDAPKPKPTKI